jgi:hypothetical protein
MKTEILHPVHSEAMALSRGDLPAVCRCRSYVEGMRYTEAGCRLQKLLSAGRRSARTWLLQQLCADSCKLKYPGEKIMSPGKWNWPAGSAAHNGVMRGNAFAAGNNRKLRFCLLPPDRDAAINLVKLIHSQALAKQGS